MNKIYRVIWSKVRNCYVVVSEIAKAHSKGSSTVHRVPRMGTVLITMLLASFLSFGISAPVWAGGTATITGASGSNTLATIKAGKGISVTEEDGVVVTVSADGSLALLNDYMVFSSVYADDKPVVTNTKSSFALGRRSVIKGSDASSLSENNIAIGSMAQVYASSTKGWNTALGYNARTGADKNIFTNYSTAIGSEARVFGDWGISIGNASQVGSTQSFKNDQNITVYATANKAVAIGNQSSAYSDNSVAIGSGANAGKITTKTVKIKEATAIGNNSKATNNSTTAIGSGAKAFGTNSSAIGANTVATGIQNIAIGMGTEARKYETMALGFHSVAAHSESIAVGHDSVSFGDGSLAIGHLALTGMPVIEGYSDKAGIKYVAVPTGSKISSQPKDTSKLYIQTSDGTVLLYECNIDTEEVGNYYKVKAKITYDEQGKAKSWSFVKVDKNGIETTNNNDAVQYRAVENKNKDVRGQGYSPVDHIDYFIQIEKDVDGKIVDVPGTKTNTLDGGIAIGSYTVAQGEHSLALGLTSAAYGKNSVAQGLYASAYGEGAIAFGHEALSGAHVKIEPGRNKIEDVYTINFSVSKGGESERTLLDGSIAKVNKNSIYLIEDGNIEVNANGKILKVGDADFGYDADKIKLKKSGDSVKRDADTGYYYYQKNGKNVMVSPDEILTFTGTDGQTVDIAAGKMTLSSGGISFGSYSHAEGDKAMAIGRVAGAYGRNSTAVGQFANSLGEDSMAIGHNASAGAKVDMSTLDEEHHSATIKLTDGMPEASGGKAGIAIGSYSHAAGDKAVAIGRGNIVTGDDSIAIGTGHKVRGNNSGAFGDPNVVNAHNSYIVGNESTIDGSNTAEEITVTDAFVMGNSSSVDKTGGIVFGSGSSVTAENGLALGNNAAVSVAGGVALGNESVATRELSEGGYNPATREEKYTDGTGVWESSAAAVSVGGMVTTVDDEGNATTKTVTRQITNVAAGSELSDAVNVAQLKAARVELEEGANITLGTKYDPDDGHMIYTINAAGSGDAIHFYSVNSSDETAGNYDNKGATGNNALAAGVNAKASGDNSVAVGNDANAKADNSIAIGNGAKAKEDDAIAIGSGATAKGVGSIALGRQGAKAVGWDAMAWGVDTKAKGDESTAWGTETKAKGDGSTAFGFETVAKGDYSTAWGEQTKATGEVATAWGSNATAKGDSSTAWGDETIAAGTNATAWGVQTKAKGFSSTAFGYYTKAKGEMATAWGSYTNAAGNSSTAFGERSTAYGGNSLAALGGTTGSDAEDGNAVSSVALGKNAVAFKDHTYAIGQDAEARGDNTIALGNSVVAEGKNAVAIGSGKITRQIGTLIETDSHGETTYSFTDGSGKSREIEEDEDGRHYYVNDSGTKIYLGSNDVLSMTDNRDDDEAEDLITTTKYLITEAENPAQASGDNSIAVGMSANASGNDGIAIGTGSGAGEDGAIAFGNNASATKAHSVALGSNSSTTEIGGMTELEINGKTYRFTGTPSADNGTVSVGSAGKERTITNVAPGRISDSSTDAINGSQLYAAIDAMKFDIVAGDNVEVIKETSNGHTKYTIHSLNAIVEAGENVAVKPTTPETTTGTNGQTTDITSGGNGTAGGTAGGAGETPAGTGSTEGTGGTALEPTPSPDNKPITPSDTNNHTTTYIVGAASSKVDSVAVAQGDSTTNGNTTETKYTVTVTSMEQGVDAEHKEITPATPVEKTTTFTVTDTRNRVVAGDNITVTASGDDEKGPVTYTISAKAATNVKVIKGEHTTVTPGKDGDFTTYAVNVMTDGKVASGDSGIVTGDTVYRETRVEKDGNYIKKDNTAAENITALDEKVKDNATSIENLNNEFNNTYNQMNRLDDRMRKGLAGAAALAALHPMDFDPDDKLQFSAGVGNYRSETAAAIGAFYRPNEKVMFSIGGTFGNSDNLINAGITFGLDGNRNRIPRSRNAMAHEIVELKEHIARQDEQIAKQDEQIAKLTELVNKLAGKEQNAETR